MSDIYNGFEPFFKDVSVNPSIIPYTDKHNLDKTKDHFLILDSRDRDIVQYPDIHEYTINLNEPFENVVSVEVLNTSVPFYNTIVDDHNNKFKIKYNDFEYDVELPELIMSQFSTPAKINDYVEDVNSNIAVIGNGCIKLEYQRWNKTFIFKTERPLLAVHFALFDANKHITEVDFTGNKTLANLLGFNDQSYLFINGSIGSVFKVNLTDWSGENYIILKIKNVDIYKSTNKALNKATAIIYENPDSFNMNYIESLKRKHNPPISFSNLNIKFLRHSGGSFHLSKDHTIQLKITTLKQGRRM